MIYTPLKMKPCFKDYLWGGSRLKQDFCKPEAPNPTAESWELACHAAGNSVVASGPLRGKSVAELGNLSREGFWGSGCRGEAFPIMVKLIDAKHDLSIQVHPSDETAQTASGEQGKAEMWYIVDCTPQARIYCGFSRAISEQEFLQRARDGTICEVLNRVSVSKGDVFYILPGTIHAIGAGNVIAEIQQNSNTTFRVYDYNRRGADGKLRKLDLERAAKVVDYTPTIPEECRANSGAAFPGFTLHEMFACRYFRAYRIDVYTEVLLTCDGSSFQHLLCVEGGGEIRSGGESYPFRRGESYFLPAALGEYTIEGSCRVLLSRIGKDGES